MVVVHFVFSPRSEDRKPVSESQHDVNGMLKIERGSTITEGASNDRRWLNLNLNTIQRSLCVYCVSLKCSGRYEEREREREEMCIRDRSNTLHDSG